MEGQGDSNLQRLGQTRLVEECLAENREILLHKWFESERMGRDVGYEYARVDWVLRHRKEWCRVHGGLRGGGGGQ